MPSQRAVRFSNAVLLSVAAVCGLVLAYAALRSDAYPPGALNLYIVALAAGLLMSVLAFRLPPTFKLAAALSIVSFVAGLYLVESILYCCAAPLDPVQVRASAAHAAGRPFDTRSRFEVFNALLEAGQLAYPGLNAAQMAPSEALLIDGQPFYPLAGISGAWTLHCNESGDYTYYQADEHGFNNPAGQHARSDLVLLGDSFAHGNCVTPGQDIAGQLRQRQWPALNLGYSGDGPLMMLATLREYAAPLEPRLILWLHYEGNDLQDLAVEQRHALFVRYLEPGFSQDLRGRQPAIDAALTRYIENKAGALVAAPRRGWLDSEPARLARLHHLRERLQHLAHAAEPVPPAGDAFAAVLAAARDETAAHGGQLVFVYLPSWRRYGAAPDDSRLYRRAEVLAIAHSLGLPLVDVHPAFLQHPDPLALFPFRIEGHYTAEGYALVARAIEAYLAEAGAR